MSAATDVAGLNGDFFPKSSSKPGTLELIPCHVGATSSTTWVLTLLFDQWVEPLFRRTVTPLPGLTWWRFRMATRLALGVIPGEHGADRETFAAGWSDMLWILFWWGGLRQRIDAIMSGVRFLCGRKRIRVQGALTAELGLYRLDSRRSVRVLESLFCVLRKRLVDCFHLPSTWLLRRVHSAPVLIEFDCVGLEI